MKPISCPILNVQGIDHAWKLLEYRSYNEPYGVEDDRCRRDT